MENTRYLALVIFLIFSQPLLADEIYLKSSRATVLINPARGTTIEFPRAIRSVEKSSHFQIKPVVKRLDGKLRTPIDIKSIHIVSNSSRSRDHITVRLSGGKSIILRLKTSATADYKHRVHLTARKQNQNLAIIGKYLTPKIKLLKAMLEGVSLNGFEITEEDESIDGEDDLEFELVRKYRGKDHSGYIIQIENDGDTPKIIDIKTFVKFSDQKVTLAHIGSSQLPTCETQDRCKTYLYLVTSKHLVNKPDESFEFPFSLEAAK